MTRAFRWLPYAGSRHAIRRELVAHETGDTLCGVPVTVPGAPSYVTWCWPTCVDCDLAWRAHEGIPTFPRARATRPLTRTKE